jgi:lipopolysaccharide/colanic/teichoic acid biosynthesis glycosyltransferase
MFMLKRCLDCGVAIVTLVLLSPLLGVLALAVKLTSRGPVFYRAWRVGRGGIPFRLLKFRSMRVDAGGPALTAADDERVTPLGRWLRASKLDELPQMWNVFCGEMSLVGPRPEAPCYVAQYSPEQRQVLALRPGVTGLASVIYAHEEEELRRPDYERYYTDTLLPRKLALELAYLHTRSLWLDLRLLVDTCLVVFMPAPSRIRLAAALMTSIASAYPALAQ